MLIWGIGGGVALAALQIAKLLGARTIVTSGSDAKLETARGLGADVALNHRERGRGRPRSREHTGGRGADVVVDSVGEQTWTGSLRALRRGGRLVVCGATTGPMVSLRSPPAVLASVEHSGVHAGQPAGVSPRSCAMQHEGRLWPVVDRVVPLAEGARRLRAAAAG